jgi:hypothetical protein
MPLAMALASSPIRQRQGSQPLDLGGIHSASSVCMIRKIGPFCWEYKAWNERYSPLRIVSSHSLALSFLAE